jgi:hypothetical protein
MQIENRPLADLTKRLRAEARVWVRLAANRPQDDWQLSLLEVTLGEAPPGWKRQRWSYERALFVASAPAGATVARWLERRRIPVKPFSLKILPGGAGARRAPTEPLRRHLASAAMAVDCLDGERSR